MLFALSTRWNATRHAAGEALADEIRAAGFDALELGYDLHPDLLPGVMARVREGAVRVLSLHAPCPIPLGLPSGHPEYFTLADTREAESGFAVRLVRDTLRLGAELGARAVVVHAGNVAMPRYRLLPPPDALPGTGPGRFARWLDRRRRAAMEAGRIRAVQPHLDALARSIEMLLPDLDETGVQLALENLPAWESVPNEAELVALLDRFNHPRLRAWHDLGHGFIRDKMGFAPQARWLEKLAPHLAGLHIHDVNTALHDHLEPGAGILPFADFCATAALDIPRVIEVRPALPLDRLQAGLAVLRAAWEADPAAPALQGDTP